MRSSSSKSAMQKILQPEYYFDEEAADRAVQFFAKCLTHTKGEWKGQPFILSDWQRDQIIRPLFGWKRTDGTRKYRTCLIQIPRKAGKSMLAAASGAAPAPVKAACALLVSDLYEHREAQTERPLSENRTFCALLNPYRAMDV